jgi:predicted dehydrogenase
MPSRVLGAASRPLGIGFVGAGMVGQVAHIANYVNLPGCRVVALAELRPELGRLAAARFCIPRVYESHHALLKDKEVEAVVVVTRPAAQGPIVLDVLESGRDVLSEKPMAHTVEQAQRLADAAMSRDLRYAVGFMKRHDAGMQRAKVMVDAARKTGELGGIVLVRAWCYGGEFRCGISDFVMTDEARPDGLTTWPIAPDWIPPDSKTDYAWFLNVFLHDLNVLRYLAGYEPQVRAVDFSRKNGRVAMLDFGAFPAVLEMAEIASPRWQEGVEILFERGKLTLQFPSPMQRNTPARVTLERYGEESELIEPATGWSWCFRRQAEAFLADVSGRREPLASGKDSVNDLRLAEAIWRHHLGIRT